MNIYFDFEATQFSERIIAIGASCEYGDFDCLVRQSKKNKLTPFITQLTGITKEMLAGAPDAEEAFTDLYNWISEMTAEADTPIFYHCYGDSDTMFLMNTANGLGDSPIRLFVENLAKSLIDDSRLVKRFFHAKSIGLYKALKFFEENLPAQTHDPLDDAILLRKLMEHVETAPMLEQCPFQECAGQPPQKKEIVVPKINGPFVIIATHTTEENAKPKQFHSYSEAVNWAYLKTLKKNPSAGKETVERRVIRAIEQDKNYIGWHWHKEDVKKKEKV